MCGRNVGKGQYNESKNNLLAIREESVPVVRKHLFTNSSSSGSSKYEPHILHLAMWISIDTTFVLLCVSVYVLLLLFLFFVKLFELTFDSGYKALYKLTL